jgi:hypothetical protein
MGELGSACDDTNFCQSGFCVDGVCCESACDGLCEACHEDLTGQTTGLCEPIPADVDPQDECQQILADCVPGSCDGGGSCRMSADDGALCRPAAGLCDVAETCISGVCPVDALADAGTVCRAAVDTCDVEEICPGASNDCPADELEPDTSLACAPYACTGASSACTTSCTTNDDCAPDGRTACVAGACMQGKLAFLTSTGHASGFGTVTAADQICQTRADAAGLDGVFRAWIATAARFPSERFDPNVGPWLRTGDLALIAVNLADLADGTIGIALRYDEFGENVEDAPTIAWTGVTAAGTPAQYRCADWTATSVDSFAYVGAITARDEGWTHAGIELCNEQARFYCFEQ